MQALSAKTLSKPPQMYEDVHVVRKYIVKSGRPFQVLGVRARDTGRGTSQVGFIKAGCHEARISITLWNEGPEAYLPEVYGDEIIIERRVGRNANYTIKNADGRKVGSRKDELEAILEALQINAANPITVMTQVNKCQVKLTLSPKSTLILMEVEVLASERVHLLGEDAFQGLAKDTV